MNWSIISMISNFIGLVLIGVLWRPSTSLVKWKRLIVCLLLIGILVDFSIFIN